MWKRWLLLSICVLFAVTFLAIRFTVRDTSPLRVGSKPDEAWTYIHTSAAWGGMAPNFLGVKQSHKWSADGENIYRETEFTWKSGSPIAFRKTTFYYGTNNTIRRVWASWKYAWPSAKKNAQAWSTGTVRATLPQTNTVRDMTMRSFHLNGKVFDTNVARLKGSNQGEDSAQFLRWYFQTQGIDLSSPAALMVSERAGTIMVYTTSENHAKIQNIMLNLNSPLPPSKSTQP